MSFHGGLTGARAYRASGEHRITARVQEKTLPAQGNEAAYVQFAAPGVKPLRCRVAAFAADPTDEPIDLDDQVVKNASDIAAIKNRLGIL